MASGTWWVIHLQNGDIVNFALGAAGGPEGGLGTELATVTQSATKPTGYISGPYPTQAAAQKAAVTYNNSQAKSFNQPVTTVSEFLSRLTQASTWLRVLEVVLGVVVLAVGMARITNAVPVVTKIARTAAKGAVLA